MAIINSLNLRTMLEDKADWSARAKIIDDLVALEAATPTVTPELPQVYDIDDVVAALVALGLVTVATS